MKTTPTYTVIFRMGGYLNATWHRMAWTGTLAAAEKHAAEIERGGRRAIVTSERELAIVGMPVGYCASCDPITGACRGRRTECRDCLSKADLQAV